MKFKILGIAFFLNLFFVLPGRAQVALIDELVQAGELTLFPDINNRNNYYYLLDKAAISTKSNGDPDFSFVKYVDQNISLSDINGIDDAPGGGFFHALIEFNITDDMLSAANSELRRLNSNGKILGPAIYDQGTVKLISALENEDGTFIQRVVGMGSAPILEGQKVAISVALTKKGAVILEEVFKNQNALLALGFEMQLSGYRSPRQVKIEANFENIYQHQNIQAAVVSPIFASEINNTFDELRNTGAIKVTQINADEDMEKALETAYSKLTNIIFDLNGNGAPNPSQLSAQMGQKPTMLDRVTGMLDKARNEVRQENVAAEKKFFKSEEEYESFKKFDESTKKGVQEMRSEMGFNTKTDAPVDKGSIDKKELPSFAIGASYILKKEKKTGNYKIDLNKYTVDTRLFPFSENIEPGNCASCFTEIDLESEFYKQRIISAQLDGFNSASFDKYVNYVTLLIQKKHQNGQVTQREIKIDRSKFNTDANNYQMVYGWKEDANRNKWLEYEYKSVWSYFGGYVEESEWKATNESIITLAPLYRNKRINIEADPEFINNNNIRAIDVRLFYNLGNKEYLKETTLNFSKENGASKDLEIILENNSPIYKYEATFYIRGKGEQEIARRETRSGSIYFDNFKI